MHTALEEPPTLEYGPQRDLTEHRSPVKEILWLALPTVLQMLAYTVEQFTDALMLSRVSDLHATACGNAGGIAFAVISFGFGVAMLINAMVSEHYGAKNYRECGPYLWQGIYFAIAYSVVVFPLVFVARSVFTAMGHTPELVDLEVQWFNISVAWTAFKMLAIVLGQFMLAINRPMVVLFAASCGMVANVFTNWVLIFGKWGFPELGIRGSSWGTNMAITVELVIVAIVVFGPSMREKFNVLAARFDPKRFFTFLRLGVPSGVQTTGDVLAWNLFIAYVMAAYGTAAMAANVYMIQYLKLSFMPAFGLSTAVTALVARHIGAGRPDLSARRAHLGFGLAAIYMLCCAALFGFGREPLMRVFTHDPEVIRIGGILLLFCAAFQFFDAMVIVYNGALRGARDTFVPATMQIVLCWTILVGGGIFVSRHFREWGVAGPWTMGCVYCVVLGFFYVIRFRAGGWKKNLADRQKKADMETLAAEVK